MALAWNPDFGRVDLERGGLGLVVAWRTGANTIQIGQINVSPQVAEQLRINVRNFVEGVDQREPRAYATEGALEPEEFFAIPAGLVTDNLRILARSRSLADLDLVTANDIRRRNLLFYAVVIGPPDDAAVFISKSNPSRIAQRGFLITTMRDGLSRINDPILIFDPMFDIGATRTGLAVIEQPVFELLFRQTEMLRAVVGSWVHEVAGHLPMDPDDETALIARVQRDSRLGRRLRAIHERGHLRDVPIERIREEIERNGLDPDRFVENGRLVWEEADTPTLLRILNEDLFTGGFSGVPFIADRKTTRG